MAIRAIETQYHGYSFRSRMEARWAVLFDAMKITWDYELEGVSTSVGAYLPDFWLSNVGMWAEVKPTDFTPHQKSLVQALACESGFPALMLVGTPEYKPYVACMPDHGQEIDYYLFKKNSHLWASYGGDEDIPCLLEAVKKSRGARFEHGEHGGRLW